MFLLELHVYWVVSCNKLALPVMQLKTQTKAATNFSYKNKN